MGKQTWKPGNMVYPLPAVMVSCADKEGNNNIITVAFPSLYGYSETSDDGTRRGIIVDYLNEIAKYTNWEYEFLDVTMEEIPKLFADGKIDILGSMFYENAPSGVLAYPKYSIGCKKIVLLARANDDSLKGYDLSTLDGKTIGVYDTSSEDIKNLDITSQIKNITAYTYVIVGSKDNEKHLKNSKLLYQMLNCKKEFFLLDNIPHDLANTPQDKELFTKTLRDILTKCNK